MNPKEEALNDLLKLALNSPDFSFTVFKLRLGFTTYQSGGKELTPNDETKEIIFKEAMTQLENDNLIRPISNKREIFQLTLKGIEKAKLLFKQHEKLIQTFEAKIETGENDTFVRVFKKDIEKPVFTLIITNDDLPETDIQEFVGMALDEYRKYKK